MLKRFIGLLLVYVIIFIPATMLLAGTLIEDFDDGNMEGWERSPQNKDSKVFWGIKSGAMVFDPKGIVWNLAIGQLNFVGTSKITNVREWTNYDFEADLKHEEMANWPGGIRARVNLD